VILEMMAKWREGYDVVYGRRRSRAGETRFKLLSAKLFYRLFAAMIPVEVPLDTGDFRLMSRRVVQTLRGLRETHRFVRGLVAWVGFKQTAVEYDRAARAAGETKYPLRKMLAFAFDGIASFSILPLRAASYVGALVGAFGVVVMLFAIVSWMLGKTIQGWTTIIILLSFLFSVQLVIIGVLGEYVGKIYEEVKRRPLYIVAERINFARRRRASRASRDPRDPRDQAASPAMAMTPSAPPALPTMVGVPSPVLPPSVPAPPKLEELDSSALKTDYGTTPAILATLPRPRSSASPSAPPPRPSTKPPPKPKKDE